MKVRVLKNTSDDIYDDIVKQHALIVGKEYRVLEISDSTFRLLNECKEPILFDKNLFEITDPTIPKSWIKQEYEDGEYSITPPEFLTHRYFFEEYFDGNSDVIQQFNNYLISIQGS
ncbi:hypothetical protein [Acinetobacter sp. ANC 3882]|uniref:hypothetical protein n=1 Tax=Acinetobacter sp. ANC 3882 TaxID=2923423 RepID=UPI001F4A51CF|nr:hypothetical protein [Acinetobacter sp. ANC 3882]MCH7315480.1 hypothetical protein [Acinetobacter sp. ANC 3882]